MKLKSNLSKAFFDVFVTCLMWTYFTIGFVLVGSPIYIGASLVLKDRESAFQYLNSIFLKGFFALLRAVTGINFEIDPAVRSIRSAVVVCNHRSYLDPILLISLFSKHKTIVKSNFFHVPIFGSIIKIAGYIPSSSGENLTSLMIQRVESIQDFIHAGGVLFIFPEGTRTRNGTIGNFGKGAFTIAFKCHAPMKVLFIRHTNNLFEPGKFLFNTAMNKSITVDLIATIDTKQYRSISELQKDVRNIFEMKLNRDTHDS